MNTVKTEYLHSLDFLRGLAALVVCIFHLTGPGYFSEDYWLHILFEKGYLGVYVFFVISGFVIPFSMEKRNYKIGGLGKFLAKRLLRLEPAYLLSIVLALGIAFLSTWSPYYSGGNTHINWLGILYHLGYLNAFVGLEWINPVYWTLAIEFQFYLLMALIFPILSRSRYWFLLMTGIYMLVYVVTDISFLFRHIPYFVIGIAAFRLYCKKDELKITIVYWLLAGAGVYQFDGWMSVISAFIPLLFIFFVKTENKVAILLGAISYSLYLTHGPIGQGLMNFSDNFGQGNLYMTLMAILATALSLLFAYLFYRLIEKPSKEFSKKINY